MLLEPHGCVVGAPSGDAVLPARRALRRQIARLEAQLARCSASAAVPGDPAAPGSAARPAGATPRARVLDLGALEALRDDLAERLRRARREDERVEEERAGHRRRLEDMLARPSSYRWQRVANRDLGEPGCGVWQVRPRLGLIGMLAGWWHVKLSSGCPLPGAA